MEYKVITPTNSEYPQKLIKRLGDECPDKIYYSGPLDFLNHFTMAVVCSDESGGLALMETNQVLFTVRDYEINYIGSWHSVIETEIFRLSLFKNHTTTTLFSAKGLTKESFESFLEDRFYPPLHEFPERDEYFRRAEEDELLMLSISDPDEGRQLRKNIMARNWLACLLADIIFIPYGPKGSKTYITAKKVIKTGVPVFTIDHKEAKDLHQLGIHGFNRKTVKQFLEDNGAKLGIPQSQKREIINPYDSYSYKVPTAQQLSFLKESGQLELGFKKDKKKSKDTKQWNK